MTIDIIICVHKISNYRLISGFYFMYQLLNNEFITIRMSEMNSRYTTRSGRNIRTVERFEPDPDTVFIDDSDTENDYSHPSEDVETGSVSCDESCDESVHESDLNSDDDSFIDDDDVISDVCSEVEVEGEYDDFTDDGEDDDDVLDWERLTDQATDDESGTEDDRSDNEDE